MARKKSYPLSRLTAEQESLLRQEEELRRREALLKRRLQQLPAAMEKKRRRHGQQRAKPLYTTLAEAPRRPGALPRRERQGAVRGPSFREKRAAKIKFVLLVLVLTSLLVLIWRSLPA